MSKKEIMLKRILPLVMIVIIICSAALIIFHPSKGRGVRFLQ